MDSQRIEALNREYNAFVQAPGFDKDAIYRSRSARALARVERVADIVFDERSNSKLDIYPAGRNAPLFVWFHGGYWRSSSKDENAFVAPALVERGIAVASVDYTLAPRADIGEIVRQVYASVGWLHANGAGYGLDVRRIHVGGHSAGGHLTGMLCADGWQSSHGLPDDIIGTAMPISGIFDLEPMQYIFVNAELRLTPAQAEDYSPVRHVPQNSDVDLLISYGGNESSEFARQTKDYAAAWSAAGNAVESIDMPGFHHFDVILELENPESPLVQRLAERI